MLQHTIAVTRQIPLGAAERVPDACAWTNSTREESFEPLVAHHLRLDTSSGPALRLLRTHTARVLTTQMPETRRLRLPRLHTCPQTSDASRAGWHAYAVARHRQGHKPDPQRDCGPGKVASSMACDHGERTYGDQLRSPTLTWLTGPTKQLSRSRPSLHVDTKHWIRPASNLVKFGPAD